MPGVNGGRTRLALADAATLGTAALLHPVLKLVRAAVSNTVPVYLRPSDDPHANISGHDTDRLLILGAGIALGWGVASHGLALPGALARAVSLRTRRGTEVDLVADPDMDASSAVTALDGHDLSRYDAIVVVLGLNDALNISPARRWRRDIAGLLAALVDAAPVGAEVIVLGIQPVGIAPIAGSLFGAVAARHARSLNQQIAGLCNETPRATFVSLDSEQPPPSGAGRHPTAADYARWGNTIADRLVPLMAGQYHLDGDRRRHHGLHRLDDDEVITEDVDIDRGPLQSIMGMARRAFSVPSAAFSLIDTSSRWNLALVESDLVEIDPDGTLCDMSMLDDGPLLVRDARGDARFADHPLVTGGPRIRFFAAFPIESPDHDEIGALCVFDSEPRRRVDDIDLVGFAELARAAQHELWHHLPEFAASDDEHANGA